MNPAGPDTQTTLPAVGVTERCFSFDWNGLILRGILSLPPEPSGAGLVTVHGWASNRGGPSGLLVKLCRGACVKGATALRFDLPGRGESGGEYAETSLDDMIDATAGAVEALLRRNEISHLVLAGICSGANAALASAVLGSAGVDAVLALSPLPYQEHRSPAQRVRRSLNNTSRMLRKALRFSTWKRLFRGEIDLKGVGKAVSARDEAKKGDRNLKESRRDIPSAMAGYEGRISLVWGSRDAEARGSERYFRRIAGPARLETHYVEGANHNFYSVVWQEEVWDHLSRLLAEAGSADTINSRRKGDTV